MIIKEKLYRQYDKINSFFNNNNLCVCYTNINAITYFYNNNIMLVF